MANGKKAANGPKKGHQSDEVMELIREGTALQIEMLGAAARVWSEIVERVASYNRELTNELMEFTGGKRDANDSLNNLVKAVKKHVNDLRELPKRIGEDFECLLHGEDGARRSEIESWRRFPRGIGQPFGEAEITEYRIQNMLPRPGGMGIPYDEWLLRDMSPDRIGEQAVFGIVSAAHDVSATRRGKPQRRGPRKGMNRDFAGGL